MLWTHTTGYSAGSKTGGERIFNQCMGMVYGEFG